jgi:hypothetical protein
MITYEAITNTDTGRVGRLNVYADKTFVGRIEQVGFYRLEYQYSPKGKKGGQIFNTLEECKKSLD